jgi:hypothetical protein
MDYKSRIKELLSHHHLLCTGKTLTDEYFEEYFLNEYTPMQFMYEGDDFLSYKDAGDYIWIQDFCSDNMITAGRLFLKMFDLGKTLKCQVAITNIKALNPLIRKGFRIVDLKGYNYILER